MDTEQLLTAVRDVNVIIVVSVFLLLQMWEFLAPYFVFWKKRPVDRVRHAAKNLAFGAVNALVVALLFSGLWLFADLFSEQRQLGLAYRMQLEGWPHLAFAVLAMDAWTYWWHRINHEVPFFWRFHSVHHSDRQMDVTTAYRFHLGEIVFSSLFRIPLVFLLGIHLWQLIAYEVLMFACVQFHHANIGISERWDRILRVILVTPYMHKVHHSLEWRDLNTNYTSLFSFWDRLFGTFKIRHDPREIQFGVQGLEGKPESLTGMASTPFIQRGS